MGVGHASGQNAAYDAAIQAISSPLLGDISINGAQGILVHFKIHPDYPILQISEAMNTIEEFADEEASVIFGTTTDENIAEDEVYITIIATGFEKDIAPATDTKPKGGKPDTKQPINNTNAKPEVAANTGTDGGVKRKVIVVNSDNENYYDTPTFLRKQRD